MAASKPITRPLVSVQSLEGDMATDGAASLPLPDVLRSAIRPDVVRFVHDNLSRNKRQPYAVSKRAGHQTSAESWGTGRAVSRIPRIPGSGTDRAGQGAFGNMCRGGRMFAPTKTKRRWHRRVDINQRRYAVASALAASAVPSLVLARGHLIETVPELPLVLFDSVESVEKTSAAINVLKQISAYPDAEKAKKSVGIRPGKGKMRNRRYTSRKGPLIVYGTEGSKIVKVFKNLPAVDIAHVDRLNILKLALGGHLRRFIIWTKSAFEKLDNVFGTFETPSEMRCSPINKDVKRKVQKKNPLKNIGTMLKLNPYAKTAKRMALLAENQENQRQAEQD